MFYSHPVEHSADCGATLRHNGDSLLPVCLPVACSERREGEGGNQIKELARATAAAEATNRGKRREVKESHQMQHVIHGVSRALGVLAPLQHGHGAGAGWRESAQVPEQKKQKKKKTPGF